MISDSSAFSQTPAKNAGPREQSIA